MMSEAKEEFDNMHYQEPGTFREMIYWNYIKELKQQKKELIKLIEYCCYEEDFDADFLIQRLKEIKGD